MGRCRGLDSLNLGTNRMNHFCLGVMAQEQGHGLARVVGARFFVFARLNGILTLTATSVLQKPTCAKRWPNKDPYEEVDG